LWHQGQVDTLGRQQEGQSLGPGPALVSFLF
jgi:hypothetical protein